MIRHHVRRDPDSGEPVLTIRVSGVTDIYRFALVLCRAQVEFADVGRAALRHIARRLGRERFTELDHAMSSGESARHGLHVKSKGGV